MRALEARASLSNVLWLGASQGDGKLLRRLLTAQEMHSHFLTIPFGEVGAFFYVIGRAVDASKFKTCCCVASLFLQGRCKIQFRHRLPSFIWFKCPHIFCFFSFQMSQSVNSVLVQFGRINPIFMRSKQLDVHCLLGKK